MRRHAPIAALAVVLSVFALLAPPGAHATEQPCGPVTTGPATAGSPPALRDVAPSTLRIGSAVHGGAVQTDAYFGAAAREFNIVTPENQLKFSSVQNTRDLYNFCAADQIATFAQAHGMQMRGHTMVWHSTTQNPTWLQNGNFTRDEMLQIMHDHIVTVMHHYHDNFPGIITQWDIVNEPIADCAGPSACGLRDSFWKSKISPPGSGYPETDYIDYAFRYAREADPDVKLYINEYGTDGPGPKLDGLINLASGMQSRGVPIDGLGHQFHTYAYTPVTSANMATALGRAAAINLDVAVTELDVALGIANGRLPNPAELGYQANVYKRVLDACLGQSRCKTFVTWGFTDGNTWLAPDKPCILDTAYQPKTAYHALRNRLIESTTTRMGEVVVREAENMTQSGQGSSTLNGWILRANGAAVSSVLPLAGRSDYVATVVAKGNFVAGAWPDFEVRVDGAVIGTGTADSATWKAFTLPFSASAGQHDISVTFTNDYYVSNAIDRNLTVDKVSVTAGVETENAWTKTTGSAVTDGWALYQNGYVQNSHIFEATAVQDVAIVARGTSAGGTWPTVEVRVDGAAIGTASVASTGWTTVHVTGPVPVGTHDVALAFVNDGQSESEDRNLFVDRFSISGQPAAV